MRRCGFVHGDGLYSGFDGKPYVVAECIGPTVGEPGATPEPRAR